MFQNHGVSTKENFRKNENDFLVLYVVFLAEKLVYSVTHCLHEKTHFEKDGRTCFDSSEE
jgi:hypothetical protein